MGVDWALEARALWLVALNESHELHEPHTFFTTMQMALWSLFAFTNFLDFAREIAKMAILFMMTARGLQRLRSVGLDTSLAFVC